MRLPKDSKVSPAAQPLRPYAQSLPLALLRAREAVMARLRPVLRDHDVTEQQWRVLRTLAELDSIEVTSLAERVFLLPSSLSRILRDLGQRGLIDRRASADDMRRGLVSITDQGQSLIRALTPEAAAANQSIVAAIGEAEVEDLKRRLADVVSRLGDGND
jgi:homoprotocatechuate degradation regulator HpaR